MRDSSKQLLDQLENYAERIGDVDASLLTRLALLTRLVKKHIEDNGSIQEPDVIALILDGIKYRRSAIK